MSAFLVPTFADLSQPVKDVLYGTKRKEGAFVLDHTLAASTRTADGVTLRFSATAPTGGGTAPDTSVTASYALNKSTLLGCSATGSGAVSLSATAVGVGLPGLTATVSAVPPTWGASQLALDYAHPSARITTTLTGRGLDAAPLVSASVAAPVGGSGVVLGGTVAGDVAAGKLSTWGLGATFSPNDRQSQVGVVLSDAGPQALRLFGHRAIGDHTSVALEWSQGLTGLPNLFAAAKRTPAPATDAPAHAHPHFTGTAGFSLGVAHRLDSGAMAKAKVDQEGKISLLYEGRLREEARVGISAQLDGRQLGKVAPKFGVLLDMSP